MPCIYLQVRYSDKLHKVSNNLGEHMKIKTNVSMANVSLANKDTQAAGSLNRSSILINAIARGSRQGSLLTELVSRTGLPRPTIHRILDMLIEIGWVLRDEYTARF